MTPGDKVAGFAPPSGAPEAKADNAPKAEEVGAMLVEKSWPSKITTCEKAG